MIAKFKIMECNIVDKIVGMVLGTEDASPLAFWFSVADSTKVQLDDIIFIRVKDPADEGIDVNFYGIVDEVRRRYEGIQFEGDTELVASGLLPASTSYAAHVLVTRVEPEDFIPPAPGDTVYLAENESLEKALYFDNMDSSLPAGVLRNGEAAYLNYDFINGTKGAHINISGISGIATKTSYALFLLYSIFNSKDKKTNRALIKDQNASKAIVFNVKGEDLLFLDKENSRFKSEEGKWQAKRGSNKNRYQICNLPIGAFPSVELHAPAMKGENLMADVRSREEVSPYLWTVREFAAQRMLPFVLTERDAMTNLGFLVSHLEEKLAKLAQKQTTAYLVVEDGDEDFFLETEDNPKDINSGLGFDDLENRIKLKTFLDLVNYLEYKLLIKGIDDDGKGGGDNRWTAQQARGTREALIRRLRGASKHISRLVRGDLSVKAMARAKLNILKSPKQVHVIDINSLAPLAQMFVVGVLLRQVFDNHIAGKGQIFIVLDELNKYAPAEGSSPIKDILLDIAERGRSLGIILIGAQQTASEVERRIVGNAAVRIVGRLDAAEAERSEYRFMPASFRMRSTILAPGTMVVHQPDIPSPIMINFPFPSWATRRAEWNQDIDDDEAAEILG